MQGHGSSAGKPLRSLLRLRHCVTDTLATGAAAVRHRFVPSLVPPADCCRPLARAGGIRRTSRRTRYRAGGSRQTAPLSAAELPGDTLPVHGPSRACSFIHACDRESSTSEGGAPCGAGGPTSPVAASSRRAAASTAEGAASTAEEAASTAEEAASTAEEAAGPVPAAGGPSGASVSAAAGSCAAAAASTPGPAGAAAGRTPAPAPPPAAAAGRAGAGAVSPAAPSGPGCGTGSMWSSTGSWAVDPLPPSLLHRHRGGCC